MAGPNPKPSPKPSARPRPGPGTKPISRAVAKVSAATAAVAKNTKARLAMSNAPGRSPQVNAQTGFTTGTVKVAATPRGGGFAGTGTFQRAPSQPSGVEQFVQSHIDQATGKQPTNISEAVRGGAERGYGALDPNRGRK